MAPIWERLMVWLALGGGVMTLIAGVVLAIRLHDPEWVRRSGSAVVCLQGVILLVEFSRRWRIRLVEETLGHSNRYVREQALRAERWIVLVSVAMAVLGEGVHGFGDLMFEHSACLALAEPSTALHVGR